MKTRLSSSTREVIIDTEGPVIIIGESINPTRRKKMAEALSQSRFEPVIQLARSQVEQGADLLDVNVGYPGLDEATLLPETVKALQEEVDAPLSIDSPNPAAIEAALKVVHGKCLINSVSGEEKSLQAILPLARDYGAAVIGLVMDDKGITMDPEKRLLIAQKIMDRAVQAGIREEDVIIDAMAMAVAADPAACRVTLETTRLVHLTLGVNITQGASNISFGLPDREVLNSAHMAMAIAYGLTCPIANPAKITSLVRAADLVLGRDEYATRFIAHYQHMETLRTGS